MRDELFNDLMESLNYALDYERGDTTKSRIHVVTVPDEEISTKYEKLSYEDKKTITEMIDRMLRESRIAV